MRQRGLCLWVAIVAVAAGSVPAGAATIVADGAGCSLADAIRSAETDGAVGGCASGGAGLDVVVLDANVVLLAAETSDSDELQGAYAGLPTITTPVAIVAGSGSILERDPNLDCDPDEPSAFRFLNVVGGELTLEGLTLRNGCSLAAGGAVAVLDGGALTLTDCLLEGNSAVCDDCDAEGGAVSHGDDGALTVTGSLFRGNRAHGRASLGGALRSSGVVVAIDGNRFEGNAAEGRTFEGDGHDARGGALALLVSADAQVGTVSENVFAGNQALGGDGTTGPGGSGQGGAIYGGVEIGTFTGNLLVANEARGGASPVGGGFASGGGADLVGTGGDLANNSFRANRARGGSGGGGAAAGALAFTWGSLSGSSFVDNEALGGDGSVGGAADGGAVLGQVTLHHVTVHGNRAVGGAASAGAGGDARGGGVFATSLDLLGFHVTIAANRAQAGDGVLDGAAAGGGIYLDFSDFALGSSILGDNVTATPAGGDLADDCAWTEGDSLDASGGFNLVEAPAGCTLDAEESDQTGVGPGLLSPTAGPCATPLGDGTCIVTVPLAAGSAAIDAGSCSTSGVTADARGFARPVDVAGEPDADDGCDAGATEWTDADASGLDDGVEIFDDGFEGGTLGAWSDSRP